MSYHIEYYREWLNLRYGSWRIQSGSALKAWLAMNGPEKPQAQEYYAWRNYR